MKSDDLKQNIVDHQKDLDGISLKIDEVISEIKGFLPGFISEWIDKEVKKRIDENPEWVLSFGKEKLSVFKERINLFKTDSSIRVNEAFEQQHSWFNKQPWPSTNAGLTEKEKITEISRIYSKSLTPFGEYLLEVGLISSHAPPWSKFREEKMQLDNPERDLYQLGPIPQFGALKLDYARQSIHISNLEKELTKALASELFDSA